jgi:hypothetical protein
MNEHTPTLWKIITDKKGRIYIVDAQGYGVCEIGLPSIRNRSVVDSIVHAVNVHKRLVDVLRSIAAATPDKGTRQLIEDVLDKAEGDK